MVPVVFIVWARYQELRLPAYLFQYKLCGYYMWASAYTVYFQEFDVKMFQELYCLKLSGRAVASELYVIIPASTDSFYSTDSCGMLLSLSS